MGLWNLQVTAFFFNLCFSVKTFLEMGLYKNSEVSFFVEVVLFVSTETYRWATGLQSYCHHWVIHTPLYIYFLHFRSPERSKSARLLSVVLEGTFSIFTQSYSIYCTFLHMWLQARYFLFALKLSSGYMHRPAVKPFCFLQKWREASTFCCTFCSLSVSVHLDLQQPLENDKRGRSSHLSFSSLLPHQTSSLSVFWLSNHFFCPFTLLKFHHPLLPSSWHSLAILSEMLCSDFMYVCLVTTD